MVSLLRLAKINEDGVLFSSPVDGTQLMLTPEKSMEAQVCPYLHYRIPYAIYVLLGTKQKQKHQSVYRVHIFVREGPFLPQYQSLVFICQNAIGADIIMALDDVVSAVHQDRTRVEEATLRTTR